MKKHKLPALCATFLLFLVFWLLLTGEITQLWDGLDQGEWQILISGALISLLVAVFSARYFVHEKAFWLLRPDRLLLLIFYCLIIFPIELIKANTDMALRGLGLKKTKPGIVKIPTELKSEYGQSMLANSITLTPGTITLDIVEENGRSYYYVHWIDVKETESEKAGKAIKGTLETWIRRIWR